MNIAEILKQPNIATRVELLRKGRLTPAPDTETILKQWDPAKHDIFNPALRPDKTVYVPTYNEKGEETGTTTRIEKVTRIAVAFQKLIVKRAASFLFGNPVKVTADDEKAPIVDAINRILKAVKQNGMNRRIARHLFAGTEVAEYWYAVESASHRKYGKESNFKIRCAVFSPLKGDKLFPFFDDLGDLAAFSRESKKRDGEKNVTYFETWTANRYDRYKQTSDGWTLEVTKPNQMGKIPIVYASQEATEWNDVQILIDRLEKRLSNFGDTNDYHGSPKTIVKGTVSGYSRKGEAGSILEVEGEGDVKLLEWAQAPESTKLEIDTLLRMIFSISQTPDISFDAVKDLGTGTSGQTLKMLFLDAHLKAMDHMEVFDDYLQRRLSILESLVGIAIPSLAKDAETIELSAEVTPFMIDDEGTSIDNLVQALNGGIMSQQTAVSQNPLVNDADEELKRIKEETEVAAASPTALDNLMNEPPI